MSLALLLDRLMTRLGREEGQAMAEYGVILAVITVGIVAAITALSTGVQGAITNVVQNL
jgi:Flp pilus assembly pilin Flp